MQPILIVAYASCGSVISTSKNGLLYHGSELSINHLLHDSISNSLKGKRSFLVNRFLNMVSNDDPILKQIVGCIGSFILSIT